MKQIGHTEDRKTWKDTALIRGEHIYIPNPGERENIDAEAYELVGWVKPDDNGGKLYADIGEDGRIGPGTLAAFKAYRAARGAEADAVLLKALNCKQGARYIDLARGRSANEAFLYGWLRMRVAL